MPQGRRAINDLIAAKVSWPPVVVPFGLDPYGWHGARESYREICAFALEHCTLLPKVFPLEKPLCVENGEVCIISEESTDSHGDNLRRRRLLGGPRPLSMEEIKSSGELSWKTRKRWIETDEDFSAFVKLGPMKAATPDSETVREKEAQLGDHGLPYAEVTDPFGMVSEMFATDEFYIKTINDRQRIDAFLSMTGERILKSIEQLCRETQRPFILRLIGAEKTIPPFMSRADFLHFEGRFYQRVSEIASRYSVPTAFHCHGPVREIMNDIWCMGYSFIEPFEPPPRGNVTIAEALRLTEGRGVVFGGVDDVLLSTGSSDEVRRAVGRCLEEARDSGQPYILSQSATPFFDPLSEKAKHNLLLFLEIAVAG